MSLIRVSLGTCLVAMLLAGIGGYQWGVSHPTDKQKALQAQHEKTAQNYQIQLEAKKRLTEHLKQVEAKNLELSKKLSLYDRLTQNEASLPLVKINTLQLFSTKMPHKYRYVVGLAKETPDPSLVKGALAMTIMGKIGEQDLLLPVKYVESDRKEGIGYAFRHFQELSGEITLPAQFKAAAIQLRVKSDDNAVEKEQVFSWQTAT